VYCFLSYKVVGFAMLVVVMVPALVSRIVSQSPSNRLVKVACCLANCFLHAGRLIVASFFVAMSQP
jgi:hypothetical protein